MKDKTIPSILSDLARTNPEEDRLQIRNLLADLYSKSRIIARHYSQMIHLAIHELERIDPDEPLPNERLRDAISELESIRANYIIDRLAVSDQADYYEGQFQSSEIGMFCSMFNSLFFYRVEQEEVPNRFADSRGGSVIRILRAIAEGDSEIINKRSEIVTDIRNLRELQNELERTWSSLTRAFARMNANQKFPAEATSDEVQKEVSKPNRIFVSYRRRDTAKFVTKVYDSLGEEFGQDLVFFDVDKIESGTRFAETIRKALDECTILVAVMGKQWANPDWRVEPPSVSDGFAFLTDNYQIEIDWVRLEVETVLAMHKPVIPLLVGSTSLPDEFSLPESLHGIRQFQAARVRPWCGYRTDMGAVISAIKKL